MFMMNAFKADHMCSGMNCFLSHSQSIQNNISTDICHCLKSKAVVLSSSLCNLPSGLFRHAVMQPPMHELGLFMEAHVAHHKSQVIIPTRPIIEGDKNLF